MAVVWHRCAGVCVCVFVCGLRRTKSSIDSREVARQREQLARELDAVVDDPALLLDVQVQYTARMSCGVCRCELLQSAYPYHTCLLVRMCSFSIAVGRTLVHVQAQLQRQREAALSR